MHVVLDYIAHDLPVTPPENDERLSPSCEHLCFVSYLRPAGTIYVSPVPHPPSTFIGHCDRHTCSRSLVDLLGNCLLALSAADQTEQINRIWNIPINSTLPRCPPYRKLSCYRLDHTGRPHCGTAQKGETAFFSQYRQASTTRNMNQVR